MRALVPKAQAPSIATPWRYRQKNGVESRILRIARSFGDALKRAQASGEDLTILVDSTSISIRGVGTWRNDKPGSNERGRRTYWKRHTVVDPVSGQIIAETGDRPLRLGLLCTAKATGCVA